MVRILRCFGDCQQVIVAGMMTYVKAMEPLIEGHFSVGSLSLELKSAEDEEQKLELWRKLTCHAIGRWLSQCYGVTLMALCLGCYETILARHDYLQQVLIEGGVTKVLPLEEEAEGRAEIKRLIEIMINDGTGLLCEAILNLVKAQFQALDPTAELSPGAFMTLISHIRHDIEHSLGKNLIEEILAPPTAMHYHYGLTRTVVSEYRAQLPNLEGILASLVTDLINTSLVNHLCPMPLAKMVAKAAKTNTSPSILLKAISEEEGLVALYLADLFTQRQPFDLCIK